MKIIPGKYLDKYFDKKEGFVLPYWDFIEMNLKVLGIEEKELINLFGITKPALESWKKDKRNIRIDKIAVLCELFGITLDQFYDRDFNTEYQLDEFYGLSMYSKRDGYKDLNISHLRYLFDKLNEAAFHIDYFPLGYILFDDGDKYYIDPEEVSYYCKTLQLNVKYDTKDGITKSVETITYDELCDLSNILRDDWGDESYKHITTTPSSKYNELLMLSENYDFLKEYITENHDLKNELLELWLKLKKDDFSFDEKSLMAKTLLINGAMLEDGNKTLQLCKYIFECDMQVEEGNYGIGN